jgi:hypothetical protein
MEIRETQGGKGRLEKEPSPESMPPMAGIAGRPFWDPHHAGYGPIPSKIWEGSETTISKGDGGDYWSLVMKTRIEILLLEEEDGEAIQGGDENQDDFPPLSQPEGDH